MLGTKEIIEQASSLPVEERASLVDSLLKTLNAPNEEIDRKWTEVAKRRLEEILSGKVKTIPGNRVFKKVRERFSK
jgi:putative addiction module component (TIGR02574 family)